MRLPLENETLVLINGVQEIVKKEPLPFELIVKIAFPYRLISEPNHYTITYRYRNENDCFISGGVIPGGLIVPKFGMIFNVTKTVTA